METLVRWRGEDLEVRAFRRSRGQSHASTVLGHTPGSLWWGLHLLWFSQRNRDHFQHTKWKHSSFFLSLEECVGTDSSNCATVAKHTSHLSQQSTVSWAHAWVPQMLQMWFVQHCTLSGALRPLSLQLCHHRPGHLGNSPGKETWG